jgi:hypothetical protein
MFQEQFPNFPRLTITDHWWILSGTIVFFKILFFPYQLVLDLYVSSSTGNVQCPRKIEKGEVKQMHGT